MDIPKQNTKGKSRQKIYLVGLMGAGKTTIGKQLAQSLKYEFRDSDHEIEAHTGAPIPLIFELEGEEGFRIRETKMIEQLSHLDNLVLATGGGAVLNKANRDIMSEQGIVVYLSATAEQLYDRTKRDKNRPLLQTDDPQGTLRELIDAREPLYKEIADIIVDTGRGNIKTIANTIVKKINAIVSG